MDESPNNIHVVAPPERRDSFCDGVHTTDCFVCNAAGSRTFHLSTGKEERTIIEQAGQPYLESGSHLLDALFALALEEVRENSVAEIRADGFNDGLPQKLEAFETGELWNYVWTRDVSYAVDLSLASLDVERCVRSLLYKTSGLKHSVSVGSGEQILQDTGSGGSYPVSTDRVIWALAAARVRHFLPDAAAQASWTARTLPILCATIEQDRRLVFNPRTGLYRGEQSFLDWREQTYPARTKHNCLAIGTSEALSTNVGHFIILHTAAQWLRHAGHGSAADRYAEWSETLRVAINERLYDEEAGLYATYLLAEQTMPIRAKRYDLLGQCLAILAGVADADRAHQLLDNYPTGPHGPPVVHPQESTVPIYHNHAIWPFVTAYWAKAARTVGHADAAAAAVLSKVRGAALFLSNMENLDLASGQVHGLAHGLSGPVINSRRQLWSVAGFVSIVQDVLFGMETTDDAIRFLPLVPIETHARFFADASTMHLRRLNYRGKTIDVTLQLPDNAADTIAAAGAAAAFLAAEVEVNGRSVGDSFVHFAELAAHNTWTIRLRPATPSKHAKLKRIDEMTNAAAVFAPQTPRWRAIGQDGVELVDGHVRLHFESPSAHEIVFNIYRDGTRVAHGVAANQWTDPEPQGGRLHEYAVEAMHPRYGNHSYTSEPRSFWASDPQEMNCSSTMCRQDLIDVPLSIERAGEHLITLRYTNANGAINTGLTCAVKRLEIIDDATGVRVAADYTILPQTGGPEIEHCSAPLVARFHAPGTYQLRIFEDEWSRNMTYFEHNARYTGHEGGGPEPVNVICLNGVRVQWRSALALGDRDAESPMNTDADR